MPHYLRFACALALVSAAQGCYQSHRLTDAGTPRPGVDAFVNACDLCRCEGFDPPNGLPDCDFSDPRERTCCPVIGPLSPPDLPA